MSTLQRRLESGIVVITGGKGFHVCSRWKRVGKYSVRRFIAYISEYRKNV